MNTTKAIAKSIFESPRALAAVVALVVAICAFFSTVFWSETKLDDAAVFVSFAFLGKIGYLQSDYALRLVEWFYPFVVFRIPTKQPIAALTIDDVPLLNSPSKLEEILDVLKKHKVSATLFIMSGFALPESEGGMEPKDRERYLKLLKRAVAEGHELGNHLQFDKPAIAMKVKDFDEAFLHCDKFIADLQGGEKAWKGKANRWFRPASALWNAHILMMAQRHSYRTVIANCYPHDVASLTRHLNATYLIQRVRPGAVIVVHDRWHTPETLDKALPEIAKRGIKLGTLSNLQSVVDGEGSSKKD